MDIADWRRKIDAIDSQLVVLLNERASCCVAIGKLKGKLGLPLAVPERDPLVISRWCEMSSGPLDPDALERLYRAICAEEDRLEEPHLLRGSS